MFLNGDISFLGADLVAGNSTVGPESGLSLLSDLVQIAIVDFALPAINKVPVGSCLAPLPTVGLHSADSRVLHVVHVTPAP